MEVYDKYNLFPLWYSIQKLSKIDAVTFYLVANYLYCVIVFVVY